MVNSDLSERVTHLERQYDHWKAKFKEFPRQYGVSVEDMPGDCHYRHVAINLYQGIGFTTASVREAITLREAPEHSIGHLPGAEQADADLVTYFKLLEEFSHYREAEFRSTAGFFPRLWLQKPEDWGGGDNYISESSRRLRGVE